MFIDFILSFWYNLKSYIFNIKCSIFEGHYISYGVYNLETHEYNHIYDYNNLLYYYCNYSINFLFNDIYLIPNKNDLYNSKEYITVGKFIENNKEYYVINNINDNDSNNTFDIKFKIIYSIINDTIDITNEFEKFKTSLMYNNILTCNDIVCIFSYFTKKYNYNKYENYNIKMIKDDTYNEISFKNNEIIKI